MTGRACEDCGEEHEHVYMPPLPDPCREREPAPDYLWSLLDEYDCSLDADHAGDHEDETHGHSWPRADWEKADIATLIERSSLGTPEAKAHRESVPVEVAAALVRRARDRSGGPDTPAPGTPPA